MNTIKVLLASVVMLATSACATFDAPRPLADDEMFYCRPGSAIVYRINIAAKDMVTPHRRGTCKYT
ncbi:MAG TPA: hypothetical protein VNL72_02005 [Gammaproteobacteria bacterium]|nr:hypothetical protein [Gammaproteobacteria bacterium]